jgi:hypothetical protein
MSQRNLPAILIRSNLAGPPERRGTIASCLPVRKLALLP